MGALLRDAMLPNLVQTVEGAPALVHGGPFGNIAHGCNSIVATRVLLQHADLVFTEAGFGFDLGAEKFLDLKCRTAGIWPHAIVLVVTLRALKVHGGVAPDEADRPDLAALARGMENLDKQLESVRQFGLEPIVAVNVREDDRSTEIDEIVGHLRRIGIGAGAIDVFRRGGDGALAMVEQIADRARSTTATPRFMYALEDPPAEKVRKVARAIYGAKNVEFTRTAVAQIARAEALGYGRLPVCIAKTHLSLSDDERLVGRPCHFEMVVREVRIAAGAGFLVPLTGDILRMPGLPRRPQVAAIDVTPDGTIVGLQ